MHETLIHYHLLGMWNDNHYYLVSTQYVLFMAGAM